MDFLILLLFHLESLGYKLFLIIEIMSICYSVKNRQAFFFGYNIYFKF